MAKISKFIILCIFTISVAGISVIVTSYAPETAPKSALILLYISIAGLGSTLFGSIIHLLKVIIGSRFFVPNVWVSMRQGFFFSIILTVTILLNTLKILSVLEIVPIAIALILLEFFFQADKKDALN